MAGRYMLFFSVSFLLYVTVINKEDHRQKRDLFFPYLIFPKGTVYQLVGAVATPIAVPNKTVSISLGYQLNFVEPWNASEFHMPHKNRTKRDALSAIGAMYTPIKAFLRDFGFDGEICLLRSICEAALHTFNHEESGLLEEIAHSILTPSEEVDHPPTACRNETSSNVGELRSAYLDAECLGRARGDCSFVYKGCANSPLDFVSRIY